MPKIKNIIIFLVIGTLLVLIYIFFIKTPPVDDATLISSSPVREESSAATLENNSTIAQEFLTLLLSVKSIRLNDAIFSSNAFNSLRDSSIVLVPDGNEGRPNPFAPIGIDIIVPSPVYNSTPPAPIPSGTPPPVNPTSSGTP